ncbi:MAG: hypothetical protein KDC92_13275 [Bacteroidetes bacterium]|nr:hypothetical protein [Bacteroidota bacterium]
MSSSYFSCQQPDCEEYGDVQIKYRHLQEWGTSKYAYDGSETLTFIEIIGTDTNEWTFLPHNNFDTTYEVTNWKERPNGLTCKESIFYIDGRIDEYYCKEKNWYFLAAQVAPEHEIKLQFWQKNGGSSDSDFYTFYNPEYMIDTPGYDYRAQKYIGDTTIGNAELKDVFFKRSDDDIWWLYNHTHGLIEHVDIPKNYKIKLEL